MPTVTHRLRLIAAALLIGLAPGIVSFGVWEVVFYLLAPAQHEKLGELPAAARALVVAWFYLGGYKAAIAVIWDKREMGCWKLYEVHAPDFILAPLYPIMNITGPWLPPAPGKNEGR